MEDHIFLVVGIAVALAIALLIWRLVRRARHARRPTLAPTWGDLYRDVLADAHAHPRRLTRASRAVGTFESTRSHLEWLGRREQDSGPPVPQEQTDQKEVASAS